MVATKVGQHYLDQQVGQAIKYNITPRTHLVQETRARLMLLSRVRLL